MNRVPDIGTKVWAEDILNRTHHLRDVVEWPDLATRNEAFSAYRTTTRRKLNERCPTCHFTVIDWLRSIADLPPLIKDASAHMVKMRKEICTTCPAYDAEQNSCGRLILDAISPQPVIVNGEPIEPCGCRLFGPLGKATFKSSRCPAGLW